jgi:hypothetical protein
VEEGLVDDNVVSHDEGGSSARPSRELTVAEGGGGGGEAAIRDKSRGSWVLGSFATRETRSEARAFTWLRAGALLPPSPPPRPSRDGNMPNTEIFGCSSRTTRTFT